MWTPYTNICAMVMWQPRHQLRCHLSAAYYIVFVLYTGQHLTKMPPRARQTFEYCFTIRPTLIRNTPPKHGRRWFVLFERGQNLHRRSWMACCPETRGRVSDAVLALRIESNRILHKYRHDSRSRSSCSRLTFLNFK